MLETIGVILLTLIPIFNIPLFLNMGKRKHECDVKIVWSTGIWLCSGLVMVASLISENIAFQVIAVAAFIIFTFVTLYNVSYHYLHGKDVAQLKARQHGIDRVK